MPDTPFKPDAAWGVKRLRELGHRIVIITARTDALYTDPYQTTEQELANGGICYDKLICTFDKAKACVEEGISILIDDSLAHCDAASEKGISAFVQIGSIARTYIYKTATDGRCLGSGNRG